MVYSPSKATSLTAELTILHQEKDKLTLDLLHLSNNLDSSSAAVFLKEGTLRRFRTIHRCAEKIFSLYPPNQTKLLDDYSLTDLSIFLQSFLINTYGMFDNIAWVCALQGKFPDPYNGKNKLQIGLYHKAMKPYLPENLLAHLNDGATKNWFDEYAKKYRDSTVHRIPPYIPPSCLTDVESKRVNQLHVEMRNALKNHDFELFGQLETEEKSLGSPIPYVILTLSSELQSERPVILHPQIICDLMTIHELLKKFAEGMRQLYLIDEFPLKDFNPQNHLS